MASMLDRAIAAIADFNNPFYAEERQRDVANEAAAFGFWVLFWTLLFGAGATCWSSRSTTWPPECWRSGCFWSRDSPRCMRGASVSPSWPVTATPSTRVSWRSG